MTLSIDLSNQELTALAAKAPEWLRKSWASAAQAGLDQLSFSDIDEEIAAARAARRKL